MKRLKFLINALILGSAFCITVLLTMSVFNMSLGVNAVEDVVAGHGVQFDAQVEDLSEPTLYIHADGSLVLAEYPTSWILQRPLQSNVDDYLQNSHNPQDLQ